MIIYVLQQSKKRDRSCVYNSIDPWVLKAISFSMINDMNNICDMWLEFWQYGQRFFVIPKLTRKITFVQMYKKIAEIFLVFNFTYGL